ncbi:TPA: hypothetical protein I9093_002914 [Clostridium perfringens]|nr:hypothetical protein CPBEC3_28240 [Clostridium perfringens]HAT4253563.1 hypothetical protein [Clostridium perfringens]HAT4271185.1 hypothetical protein [Clostridium perfringens]HCG3172726.1 hypothetical protein [Clostridium perfringens]
MCDCCIIKENIRLINELIEAKQYIKELELKLKLEEEKSDSVSFESIEDVMNLFR